MESGGNGITFQEADRRYAELKRQRESGILSDEEFGARLRGLMVRDDKDRWWVKSPRTGDWHRHDGEQWIKDTPPEPYEPPQTTPADSTADPRSQVDRVETPPPGSTVRGVDSLRPQEQDEQPPPIETRPPPAQTVEPEGRRGVPRKLAVVGCLVVVLALVGLLALVAVLRTGGPTAPDVVGQTESEAKRNVGDDYNIYISEVRVADEPKGTVISQDPEAGEIAEAGSTISVVISAGEPPKPGDTFRDNFRDTSRGWDVGKGSQDEPWATGYALGGYRIYNPPPPSTVIGLNENAGTAIDDTIIEVDATPMTGDVPEKELTAWGIVCRALDYDNYYTIGIQVDGRPAIWRLQNDEWTEIATGRASDAVRRGNAINHLRADCVGDKLSLYVNGRRVIEAEDSELKAGQVGLFVDDNGEAIEILFDNFLVSRP